MILRRSRRTSIVGQTRSASASSAANPTLIASLGAVKTMNLGTQIGANLALNL